MGDLIPKSHVTGEQSRSRLAPVAFFVDAENPGLDSWYGPTIEHAMLSAIYAADTNRTCRFQTYWGNLLLPFTYRFVNSSAYPGTADQVVPELPETLRSMLIAQAFVVDDFSARYSLLCALCDAAANGWTTLDPIQTPWTFYTRSIYVCMISVLPHRIIRNVDQVLSENDWYLGAMEIDRGDPLQWQLFGRSLIPAWFYFDGRIGGDNSDESIEMFLEEAAANGFPCIDNDQPLVHLAEIEWTSLSESGAKSARLLRNATARNHSERITAQIHKLAMEGHVDRVVTFEASHPEPDPEALRRKLTEYVLNPQKSKGKAELFKQALGIERDDWRFLAIQLALALDTSRPQHLRDEPYGRMRHLQYDVTVQVLGRNGLKKPVRAVWKIVDDNRPELVTAYLGAPSSLQELDNTDIYVVPLEQGSSDYYRQLYETSKSVADNAFERCVPTPLVIRLPSGKCATIPEGEAGTAWVRIPDARRGFARWLVKSQLATKAQPGIRIYAPGTYLEPARAWADAMAKVLHVNGLECEVSCVE